MQTVLLLLPRINSLPFPTFVEYLGLGFTDIDAFQRYSNQIGFAETFLGSRDFLAIKKKPLGAFESTQYNH